jgi:hypothetical protein
LKLRIICFTLVLQSSISIVSVPSRNRPAAAVLLTGLPRPVLGLVLGVDDVARVDDAAGLELDTVLVPAPGPRDETIDILCDIPGIPAIRLLSPVLELGTKLNAEDDEDEDMDSNE